MKDTSSDSTGPDNLLPWTRVDNAVLPVLAAIGGCAISVYVALKSYSNRDGVCFPSLESVAKLSGASKRTCIRCLGAMMQHGLIAREVRNLGSGRASNLYRFANSPSATLAPGVVAQVPKVTTPSAKSDDSPSATMALEQEPVLNKNHKNKNQRARAPEGVDPRLLELIDQWNTLPLSIVPAHVKTNPVSPKLVTRYRTAQKNPDLREALAEPARIIDAMRKATFAHGKHAFGLLELFGKNKDGNVKLLCLLKGAYVNNGNGKQRVSGDRFNHDPNGPIADDL